MIPDPLLDTAGPVDSLTIEKASFVRKFGIWRESDRCFIARYSWNADGYLVSKEEDGGTYLYAYDDRGRRVACYSLDSTGTVSGREVFEWDEQSRMTRRIMKTLEPPAEQVWTYEHDAAGRMTAERRGNKVRVEKFDADGLLSEEYLYDGIEPDLVTEYTYDNEKRIVRVVIKDPDGTRHRQTEYSWDSDGRLESLNVTDSKGLRIKDESYAYGAVHGSRWLERVTWVSDGSRRKKKRPRDVVYRSFTYGGMKPRSEMAEEKSLAFANGVYHGPVLGDRPEGFGVFLYNDESRYDGEFRNGSMEGTGKLTWPDGREMEGNFEGGFLEGRGRCSWADGSRYDGNFRRGRMDGPGIFEWADGTRFEGLFENGRRTDQGAWERPGDR